MNSTKSREGRSAKNRPGRMLRAALVLQIAALSLLAAAPAAAQTEIVLHSFAPTAKGDQYPASGVVGDPAGNLYGTTTGIKTNGALYEVTADGAYEVLHTFTGPPFDGANPQSAPVLDQESNLYGTTAEGGLYGPNFSAGDGTAWKLAPDGAYAILHNFGGSGSDGTWPIGVTLNPAGRLLGTTRAGGSKGGICGPDGCGTVVEIAPNGAESILNIFDPNTFDGAFPQAPLTGNAGEGYGTTCAGGDFGLGTVFKLRASGESHDKVLHSFTGGPDGSCPVGRLLLDPDGDLFGTTAYGARAFGTVFELDGAGNLRVLHTFTGTPDGAYPLNGLALDAGNLYGVTVQGGTGSCYGGCGTLFEIAAADQYSLLYSFQNSPDGAYPVCDLTGDGSGNLYGTTSNGGAYGFGTVFKFTP